MSQTQINKKPYKFTGEILDIVYESITLPDKKIKPKVVLKVRSKLGKEYSISEAYVLENNVPVCKGIWFNLDKEGNFIKGSTLHSVIDFFDIKVLEELKGKTVVLRHNPKRYIVIECIK